MASRHVEETIETHLSANWTACPIFTENLQGSAPADGSAFLVLQFPLSDIQRLSTGTRRYREEGGARILIYVERGSGIGLIREWGEEIAALFRDQTINGVHCLVPSPPFTDDQSDQGATYEGSMVIPFWWQFEG